MAGQSWLSRVGGFIAKVLGVASKAEPTAAALAEALLPQFSPEIAAANDLFNRIVKQIVVAEAAIPSVDGAKTGAQKLEAVLASAGPFMDQWVTNNFAGNKQLSTVAKSGIINALVAAVNELEAPPAA